MNIVDDWQEAFQFNAMVWQKQAMELLSTDMGRVAVAQSAAILMNSAFKAICDEREKTPFQAANDLFSVQTEWLRSVGKTVQGFPAREVILEYDTDRTDDVERLHGALWGHIFNKFEHNAPDLETFIGMMRDRLRHSGIGRKEIAGKRCVDLGCGSGRFAFALAEIGAAEVVCVDVSVENLAFVQKKAQDFGFKNINCVHADVRKTPLASEHYDFVVSNGVAHHIADLELVLAEAYRLTISGGGLWLFLVGPFQGALYKTNHTVKQVMRYLPINWTVGILSLMNLPPHRFNIVLDTMYAHYYFHEKSMVTEALLKVGFTQIRDICSVTDLDVCEDTAERLGSPDTRLLAFKL